MEHHKQFSCSGMLKIKIFPQGMRGDFGVNHKNYNFLDGDWFKKKNSFFPLIHLPSCYRTVCYWTIQ